MRMTTVVQVLGLGFLCASLAGAAEPRREMNLRQGPESVFDRPVSEIMGDLAGATAAGENGRVGNELVFWGYQLADGREAYLYACARFRDVDCEQRRLSVCPRGRDATVLRAEDVSGRVRSLQCRAFSIASTGERRPGCSDNEVQSTLAVGLVQCN